MNLQVKILNIFSTSIEGHCEKIFFLRLSSVDQKLFHILLFYSLIVQLDRASYCIGKYYNTREQSLKFWKDTQFWI